MCILSVNHYKLKIWPDVRLPSVCRSQYGTNISKGTTDPDIDCFKKIKNLKMFENAAGNSVLVRCRMFDRKIGTLTIGASS